MCKSCILSCELCKTTDYFKIATIKATGRRVIICGECDSVYEIGSDGKPVFGHDPTDTEYFEKLDSLFKTWDDLTDVEPYTLE